MTLRGLLTKLKESVFSVMPITIVIIALFLLVIPTGGDTFIKLIVSSILMIIGIAFFELGAENAMIELGNGAGAAISKKNKIVFMLVVGFVIGFAITLAEPDLMVLARQVEKSTDLSSVWVFISAVSLGVGILFILSILRIVFSMNLSVLLTFCYLAVFVLSLFVPKEFVPIAFDSGSVTTGAISVPFLISFGLGLSAVRSKRSEDDSFGLIALCSVGPILAVMIMSLFLGSAEISMTVERTVYPSITQEFLAALGESLSDVAIVLFPILIMFVIFQLFSFKYPKTKVVRTLVGFLLTYIGVSLFLTGVECGYYPIGKEIGEFFSTLENSWVALPMAFVLGAAAIIAEPAMQVLKKQVEEITNKAIGRNTIMLFVSLGMALSVVVAAWQATSEVNFLMIIAPVYVACLILSFLSPKIFSAIAFDSGGVASGTMAVSFILPFVTGLSTSGGGFGTVGLIAAIPIFSMQILGIIYKVKLIKRNKLKPKLAPSKNDIIEFDYEKAVEQKESNKNIVEFDG